MAGIRSMVRQFLGKPVQLPAGIWKQFSQTQFRAPYLVSCFGTPTVLYVSSNFKELTGYPAEKFMRDGNKFWFSIIHPADMQGVVSAITKAQHELITGDPRPTTPLQLEYRIIRKDGQPIWLKELKLIVSYQAGQKDHILGCWEDITAQKENQQAEIKKLLGKKRAINGLLDEAVSYQLPGPTGDKSGKRSLPRISAREKQVLTLVAAGHSSKQIAARLSISENTVETHRRHLLEKFSVNNSTALVKEAHRLCLV